MTRLHISSPTLIASLAPIILLLCSIGLCVALNGPDGVQEFGSVALLASAGMALAISTVVFRRPWRLIRLGLVKSARQILPSFPILLLIGAISSTWMLSGVVPLLIDYGLMILNPALFLFITCSVCAITSVLTGSSWTTIATIGVAFMGIGTVLGYSAGWVAGAIISGAYFGDKVSPLSDTTVLASSAVGVSLFDHIRFTMLTSIPAMAVALGVFACVGIFSGSGQIGQSNEMISALSSTFNLTPWLLIVPALTALLIYLRRNVNTVLGVSSIAALAAMFIFQPQIVAGISSSGWIAAAKVLFTGTDIATGHEMLDTLASTGGMTGMLPTIRLVSCAMIFGGVLMGTGMLTTITRAIGRRLRSGRAIVSTTVCSGLLLNGFTGDQYLSIILGGNLYRNLYLRNGLKRRVLSRALEDSVSVTSVLIPWNSCGMTQSTVLGVATLTYLPFCIFNILSPVMSVAIAWIGWRIHAHRRHLPVT